MREEYFGERSALAQEFSFGGLMPDILAADLARTTRRFDVPVHLFVGRYDQNTPSELAVEYFDVIEAPVKRLHWFDESGHLMPFEEPVKLNNLLIDALL